MRDVIYTIYILFNNKLFTSFKIETDIYAGVNHNMVIFINTHVNYFDRHKRPPSKS